MEAKLFSDLLKTSPTQLVSIIESLICRFGDEATTIATEKLRALRQCWIIKLPPDTFSSISSQWLTLPEFCRLNSSFCHSDLRRQFNECVQRKCILFTSPEAVNLQLEPFLHWAVNHQIRLDKLNLSYRSVNTDLLLSYLKNSGDSLRSIDVAGGDYLTDECVQTMTQCCPNLEVLRCQYCTNIAPNFIASVLGRCTSLRELRLAFATPVANECLWSGFDGFSIMTSALIKLSLSSQTSLCDEHFCPIVSTCTRLVDLCVMNCQRLTHVSFNAIATHLPHLVTLVAGYTSIQDRELVQVIQHCNKLECLSVNDCAGVTDISLSALLVYGHNITQLFLNHNLHVSDNFLERVHISMPKLIMLYTDGCLSVTPVGVLCVIKHCPLLSVFSVKEYSPAFDEVVRQGIIAGKHWLGAWKDRKLSLFLSTV